jgi:hypothetical protein
MTAAVPAEPWVYPLRLGDTLATNDWIEWRVHAFLGSAFVAHMEYLDRRDVIGVAVVLWTRAYLQDPAGTLPDDDVQLARLAGFGVDVPRWRAMRDLALYGWSAVLVEVAGLPEGGRLGHPVIAEISVVSFRRKDGRKQAREAAILSQVRFKVRTKLADLGQKRLAENAQAVDAIASHLAQAGLYVTPENVRAAMATVLGITGVVAIRGGGGAA